MKPFPRLERALPFLLLCGLLAAGARAATGAPSPMPAATAPAPVPPAGDIRIRVAVSVDRTVIRVGDLIHYTLTVEAPPGSKVAMPPPGAQLGEFIIRDYNFPGLDEKEPSFLDRIRAWVSRKTGLRIARGGEPPGHAFAFTVTAYTTGDLVIPAMPIQVIDPSGRAYALHAESARVRVAPVTDPEDLTIRGLKPPAKIKVNYRPLYPYLPIPLALAAAAAAAWWLLRRRRRVEAAPIALRPEDEVALEELLALSGEGLLEAGQYERFYTRLSRILRKYLALRFSIYALEYTTAEISGRLAGADLDHADFDRVRGLLEEADRVKFALYLPALEERGNALERGREIVTRTRRRPPPEDARLAA